MFSFFKRKKTPDQSPADPPPPPSEVLVTPFHEGGHGDNWGGMLGFDELSDGRRISEIILPDVLAKGQQRTLPGGYSISTLRLPGLDFVGIVRKDEVITLFPALHTTRSMRVDPLEIREWVHVHGAEAVVDAKGNETFGINFFAADYLEHRLRYQRGQSLRAAITGIIFALEPAQNWEGFSPDFLGYAPHQELYVQGVITFVGKIVTMKALEHPRYGVEGYVFSLQLIQDAQRPELCIIDAFISRHNLKIELPLPGDRVSGAMGLHGQLLPA